MTKHCDCMPDKFDPLSDVLSRELDSGRERREAQNWAEEAKKHAEAAAQNEEAAAAGAGAAGKSAEEAEASAGRAEEAARKTAADAGKTAADAEKTEKNANAAEKAAQAAGQDAGRAEAAAEKAESVTGFEPDDYYQRDVVDAKLADKQNKLTLPLPMEQGGTGNNTGTASYLTSHALVAGDDLNNIWTPGLYNCEGNAIAAQIKNCPVGNNAFTMIVTGANPAGQIVFGAIEPDAIYFRGVRKPGQSQQDSNTWRKVYTDYAKPAPADIGAEPAISVLPIAKGGTGNANGEAARLATTTIQANEDLNNFKTAGVYSCTDRATALTIKNYPPIVNVGGFLLVVHKISGSNVVQILVSGTNVDRGETYIRVIEGSQITDWFELYSTKAKPTPADIGAQEKLTLPLPLEQGGTGNMTGTAQYFSANFIPENTDLNDMHSPFGFFFGGRSDEVATFKNCPTSQPFAMLVAQTKYDSRIQILIEYHTTRKIYQRIRYYSGGDPVWSTWTRIYSELDKPTAADIVFLDGETLQQKYDAGKLSALARAQTAMLDSNDTGALKKLAAELKPYLTE